MIYSLIFYYAFFFKIAFKSKGKRQCVAEPLARMEMYLFTSALLQNFDIEIPPGKVLDTSLPENVVYRVRAPVDQEFIFRPRD